MFLSSEGFIDFTQIITSLTWINFFLLLRVRRKKLMPRNPDLKLQIKSKARFSCFSSLSALDKMWILIRILPWRSPHYRLMQQPDRSNWGRPHHCQDVPASVLSGAGGGHRTEGRHQAVSGGGGGDLTRESILRVARTSRIHRGWREGQNYRVRLLQHGRDHSTPPPGNSPPMSPLSSNVLHCPPLHCTVFIILKSQIKTCAQRRIRGVDSASFGRKCQ